MPNIQGTTRAQSTFLRAFRQHPAGPPAADWPAPAVLRKWLRHDAFRAALHSVQHTLQFQADFHLASAAAQAAQRLATDTASVTPEELKKLAQLLRLAHLRQRFASEGQTDADLCSPAEPPFLKTRDLVTDEADPDFDDDDHDDDRPLSDTQARRLRQSLAARLAAVIKLERRERAKAPQSG